MVLNGKFTKLGQVNEIKSNNSDSERIVLECNLSGQRDSIFLHGGSYNLYDERIRKNHLFKVPPLYRVT